jgi:hypothetical protein
MFIVEIGEPQFDKKNIPKIEDIIFIYTRLIMIDKKNNIICLVYYII